MQMAKELDSAQRQVAQYKKQTKAAESNYQNLLNVHLNTGTSLTEVTRKLEESERLRKQAEEEKVLDHSMISPPSKQASVWVLCRN